MNTITCGGIFSVRPDKRKWWECKNLPLIAAFSEPSDRKINPPGNCQPGESLLKGRLLMHAYLFNIKTFDQATRHLTRVERSLYRDLIDLYYDTEQPLTAVDFDYLARRVLARTDDEKAALQCVLDEFFERTGDVYSHDYIDNEIERYKANNSQKSIAGKASAEARRKKSDERKRQRALKSNENSTHVERTLNTRSTAVQNHETITMNHKPPKTLVADAPEFINADAWNEWLEYRKQSKKKMTAATIAKQHRFLSDYDKPTQTIIINQSIQNGWAGLFEPKEKTNGAASTRKTSLADDLNDRSWV